VRKEIYYFYRTEEFVTRVGTVLSRFVQNIASFLSVHSLITQNAVVFNLFNVCQVSCTSNSWFYHPQKILEQSKSYEAALNVLKFSVTGVSNLF